MGDPAAVSRAGAGIHRPRRRAARNLLAVTPQAQLGLFGQGRFGLFFLAIHALVEWILIPLVEMLNWNRPERRWLVIAAAMAFYAGRVASALYFAPNALAWGADPSLATLAEVQQWMNLNWVRTVVQDTATAVLLLLAIVLPNGRYRNGAAAARSGQGSA